MDFNIKMLSTNARMPLLATNGSACVDLYAAEREIDYTEGLIRYKTNVAIEIPKGFVGLLFSRSSICKMKLIQSNCVGVIDSDYRGDISVVFRMTGIHGIIRNIFNKLFGFLFRDSQDNGIYKIGDRVGQLMIVPVCFFDSLNIKETLSSTERGTGGYGSTGLK